MNYVVLIRRFLNLQTCLFVLESDYADIEIEGQLPRVKLISQPLCERSCDKIIMPVYFDIKKDHDLCHSLS